MSKLLQLWLVLFFFLISYEFVGVRADTAILESARLLNRLEQQVVRKKLDNGLTVLLYRRGSAPTFSASISVKVGGVDEVIGATGISHMLEHMAFKGTRSIGSKDPELEQRLLEQLEGLLLKSKTEPTTKDKYKKKISKLMSELNDLSDDSAFDRVYREIGAEGLNATTGKETTDYFVSLPRSAFEIWCKLEADRIVNPVMRRFYAERDVVMEERRMRYDDDPVGRMYETILAKAFQVHPYGNPVIGYVDDLSNLTAKMTDDFHRQYYSAENITVAVVGDIDLEQDLELIEDYFGQIPGGFAKPRKLPVEPMQTEERKISISLPTNPQLLMAYKKPNYPSPDDAPMTVLGELLAGSRTSVLHKELVQRQKVLTAVDYFEAPASGYPNLIFFQAVPKFGYSNLEIQQKIEDLIQSFLSTLVSDEELNKVKRGLARSYIEELSSNLGLARSMASTETVYGDWRVHIHWFNEMSKVTAEDVQRVGLTYLIPTRRTTGFIESAGAK